MKKILIAACCLGFVSSISAASAQFNGPPIQQSASGPTSGTDTGMNSNAKMKKKMKMKKGMMKGDGMKKM